MFGFKLVPGKTTNSFLVKNFSIEGTEVVPHKPLYPDVACRSMYFAVDNEFDVKKYASRHGLRFTSEIERGRYHDTDGYVSYEGKVGNCNCFLTLTTRNNSPMMVQIWEHYDYNHIKR